MAHTKSAAALKKAIADAGQTTLTVLPADLQAKLADLKKAANFD